MGFSASTFVVGSGDYYLIKDSFLSVRGISAFRLKVFTYQSMDKRISHDMSAIEINFVKMDSLSGNCINMHASLR